MSPLGLILIIILVIFLVGGFSGRFGGYGYGYGHGGIGVEAGSSRLEEEAERRDGDYFLRREARHTGHRNDRPRLAARFFSRSTRRSAGT
jgi:hypothetical protein